MVDVGVHTTHTRMTFCVEHVCTWAWRHIPVSIAHVFLSCFSLPSPLFLICGERRATACVSVCRRDVVCLRDGLSECACCVLSPPLIHHTRALLVWLRVWASVSLPFASLASSPIPSPPQPLVVVGISCVAAPLFPSSPPAHSVFPACTSLPVRPLRHAFHPPPVSLPCTPRRHALCALQTSTPQLFSLLRTAAAVQCGA